MKDSFIDSMTPSGSIHSIDLDADEAQKRK